MKHPIVLFDGQCNLCERTVRFIVTRDPRARFRFAPLQSDAGKELLRTYDAADGGRLSSLVLVSSRRIYFKSSAALRIAQYLTGLWPLAAGLLIVPRPLRDAVYDFVGSRRYRWFGKKELCWAPAQEEVGSRFLSPGRDSYKGLR